MTTKAIRLDQPTSRQLLARVLDEPSLVATVQALEPRSLGKLIRHIGLEDCGEIVSLATTEQIKQVFDEDLWKSERPGKDEAFDADRFALWLEVMLEAGEDFVAQKLVDLPEELVTLAFYKHFLVIKIDAVAVEEDREGDYLTDKAIESCLYQEMGDYHLISRQQEGWDTIVAILLALDKHDRAFLERVLEHCFAMSSEYIEENGGLYDVLTSDELLESDLAADREDRRAREGFIAPSAATSFLNLGRIIAPKEVLADKRDPVTRAYFRELAPPTRTLVAKAPRALPASAGASALEQLVNTLDQDELPRDPRSHFLLEAKPGRGTTAADALFKQSLLALAAAAPKLHSERMAELAYLCNVLVAACEIDGRSFRPFEAVVAVAAVCNLGLEHLVKAEAGAEAGGLEEHAHALLEREGADKIFRVGWRILHCQIAMATCEAVARAFTARAHRAKNANARVTMERGAKFVRLKFETEKPWLARSRLVDLDVDPETLTALDALLGECPYLVGPVAAGAGGYQLDRVRQFVSNEAQIRRVSAFLEKL